MGVRTDSPIPEGMRTKLKNSFTAQDFWDIGDQEGYKAIGRVVRIS